VEDDKRTSFDSKKTSFKPSVPHLQCKTMPKEVFCTQQMTNTTPFAQRNITKGHLSLDDKDEKRRLLKHHCSIYSVKQWQKTPLTQQNAKKTSFTQWKMPKGRLLITKRRLLNHQYYIHTENHNKKPAFTQQNSQKDIICTRKDDKMNAF